MKYEVRCHESGDDSDYLVEVFDTEEEAKACIAKRDEERPDDFLYEHWYVAPVQKSLGIEDNQP